MYHVWSFFTKKRNFSYLLLIALTLVGVFAVFTLQKESNPEVQVPIGVVNTVLPGASATDVETLITNEIETALIGTLDNTKKISSVSRNGVSSITVEFDSQADIDASIQDLKDAVDTIKSDLPQEALEPTVLQIDFSQEPVLTFAVAGDLPASRFAELADTLEDELETIRGVSNVRVSGSQDREVTVVLDQDSLQQYSLNPQDVIGAISRANATLPIGSVTFNQVEFNLQFEADIENPAEVGDIVVTTVNGTPLYVRDLAFVSDGLSERSSISRVSLDGMPSQNALSFSVLKQTGGDVTAITQLVRERLTQLQADGELLESLEVLIIFDSGEFLLKDLRTLTQSGLMAVILVMAVLFITIGWRESLVAGLSIPLSFMIAFIGLLVSGNTLNFVSLFALILSVGILVDSAIVITEGIHTNMRAWMDKSEAALKTIRDFHVPVTAGTMTTVAVFVPLFFISGIVGEFIKSIPFTVISVLLASLLVALGFIPLIASILLRRRMTSKLEEKQEEYTAHALRWYKHIITKVYGHVPRENFFMAILIALFFTTPFLPSKGVFAGAVFFVVIAFVLYVTMQKKLRMYLRIPLIVVVMAVSGFAVSFLPTLFPVPVEFFPTGDEDYLIVEIELPEGSTLDATELEMRKVEEILYEFADIQSFIVTVGASSQFSGTGGSNNNKLANAFLELEEERELSSQELAGELRDAFLAIRTSQIRVTQIANGPPVGTPVVIKFAGNDLDELEQLAVEASRILESIEGTTAVDTSTKNDNTEFVITMDKAKAATYGIDPSMLASFLRASIEGTDATTIQTFDHEIDVVVKLALDPEYQDVHKTNQQTVDTLRNLTIQTPQSSVLLDSFISITLQKGSTAITHEDGKRIATAQSQLADGGNVANIVREFRVRAQEELSIPAEVEMIVGGENEETDQSFAEMGYAVIAGLVFMFAIIVLMFNSFRHSLYVIAPAFFSFIGITLGLLITQQALSFPTLMGLIALVGIVVNNSIILINIMNNLRRENPDMEIDKVVLDGAAMRLRPILLTTATTIMGVIPLLFASTLWAPLALAIIFGLSFSVMVTLLFIPILYRRNPGELG